MNKDCWLDAATEKIRFGPDREAVRRELAQHLEDLADQYAAEGLSPEEAEAAALAEMGSAQAIAPELGRIHSPWWGYIWQHSQVALTLAALLVIFFGFTTQFWQRPRLFEINLRPIDMTVGDQDRIEYKREILEEYTLTSGADLGGYRFTIPRAWLEHYQYYAFQEELQHEEYRLILYLRSHTWKFWAPSARSSGMVMREPATGGSGAEQRVFDYSEKRYRFNLVQDGGEGGAGVTWYEVRIVLDEPQAPDWLDVPVGLGSDVLHIDFTEGVVS